MSFRLSDVRPLGGPVIREKTFFFLNYDGQRTRKSLADLFSVPTQAQREGIFGATIVNPGTGQPFPGNTINVPLDPAAVALLSRIPLPNLPGATNNVRVSRSKASVPTRSTHAWTIGSQTATTPGREARYSMPTSSIRSDRVS